MTYLNYNPEFRARIKGRDEEAFRKLYQDCFHMLEQYAMRYVYNWVEAKDIVQESFFSFWENISHYDESRNPVGYLLGVVKNKCANHLRLLHIHDSHRDKIIEALLFSSVDDQSIDPEIEQRLNHVLSIISDKQMEVLRRHVLEGETIANIAHGMGISESTAKTHYSRAMHILRRNLKMILFGF